MNYNFPPTKFVDENTFMGQIDHIKSEAIEVEVSHLMAEGMERLVEELFDLIHSGETMLRMLEEEGVDIDDIRDQVEAKNRARGYYR